jgi:hypothetical protein
MRVSNLRWLTGRVIHKIDDHLPGQGLWNLAEALGQIPPGASETEKLAFWGEGMSAAIKHWSTRSSLWIPEPS